MFLQQALHQKNIRQRWIEFGGRLCDLLGWIVVWCTDTEAEDFLHWLIRVYGFEKRTAPDSRSRRREYYLLQNGFTVLSIRVAKRNAESSTRNDASWQAVGQLVLQTLVQLLICVRDL